MGEVYITDLSLNKPIKIGSIPAALATYSLLNGTMNANTIHTITWTTTPSQPQLSLWNFAWTVRFGTNAANYEWPLGSSLTTNQKNVDISYYRDAISANESINRVVHKIIMRNSSADTFSYYNYVKAYTFATSVGSSA